MLLAGEVVQGCTVYGPKDGGVVQGCTVYGPKDGIQWITDFDPNDPSYHDATDTHTENSEKSTSVKP